MLESLNTPVLDSSGLAAAGPHLGDVVESDGGGHDGPEVGEGGKGHGKPLRQVVQRHGHSHEQPAQKRSTGTLELWQQPHNVVCSEQAVRGKPPVKDAYPLAACRHGRPHPNRSS